MTLDEPRFAAVISMRHAVVDGPYAGRMPQRWTLNRAGITNVYQYDDETLRFGGGRLLLRGVNGSGKSTAMNMLLPFLLEADTRRIDAAGEQSGVLRSWMLSGRDEPQPVGYLWIEFARASQQAERDDHGEAEYLVCGCGIRANQSTDRVNTWWFVTDRRPGIDLTLVENNTPISVDTLRSAIGANAVFAHDQRAAYRDEVSRRLYEGADLDQHLRLLHIVRSPRVGDRIDVDLPAYLQAALPQLSEAALADAAQPLEDLEEHRRNVEELTRTVATLAALDTVYGNYARAEIHARLDTNENLLSEHRSRVRVHADLQSQQRSADEARARAVATIAQLETDEARIAKEIATLEASDVYREGADLTDLREHVATLDAQLAQAHSAVARQAARRAEERAAVERARAQATGDLETLRLRLDDLGLLGVAAGLSVLPPELPAVVTSSSIDEVPVPDSAVEPTVLQRRLGELRAAVGRRGEDVREVSAALDAVDRAVRALDDADRALQHAVAAEEKSLDAFTAARAARDRAVDEWREALTEWIDRVDAHHLVHGLGPVDRATIANPALAETGVDVRRTLDGVLQTTVEHHTTNREQLAARRRGEEEVVLAAEAVLTELLGRTLPDPPRAPWQTDGAVCFAELVDFDPAIDHASQARLEAALEAAGILGAEVRREGLVLADGQLVAHGEKPVENPLSEYLTVALPDHVALPVEAVGAVLDAISTEPDDLFSADERTVVTLDGRFRSGVLRGRHHKERAEHIGVSARRATLERQRAAASDALADARRTLERTDVELADASAALDEAIVLRRELPDDRAVTTAVVTAQQAESALADARERVAAGRAEYGRREVEHADSVDASLRVAATLGLPAERGSLEGIRSTLREVTGRCNDVESDTKALSRSVQLWIDRGRALTEAIADHDHAVRARDDIATQRAPVAIKLATLEDSIGLEYEQIVRTLATSKDDLAATQGRLREAREEQLDAHGLAQRLAADVANAARAMGDAEARCVHALHTLRRAVAIAGLFDSARHPGDDRSTLQADDPATEAVALPAVADSSDGLRVLTKALRIQVPQPDRSPTTADGVRQSLRQRRDALGAGWDAEDRQPDDTLPIQVEVTGPVGGRMALREATVAAQAQLRRMQGLLSAKQEAALSNLLKGLIAREVAEKLHSARELVGLMNERLAAVRTSHGIGVSLRWQRRDDLEANLLDTIDLLAKPPDLRTVEEDQSLITMLSRRIAEARMDDPEAPYRQLIAQVLDYREWHRMSLLLHRPGRTDERLTRRTALSEGEKKMVSYLPLFAAVAASCDALAEGAPSAPRFVLLDDAFAKVSEDNHPKLFGLLVQLDLDFIATSERLWGTHATVPELAITEVVRDADLGVIVLEHSHWNGHHRERVP